MWKWKILTYKFSVFNCVQRKNKDISSKSNVIFNTKSRIYWKISRYNYFFFWIMIFISKQPNPIWIKKWAHSPLCFIQSKPSLSCQPATILAIAKTCMMQVFVYFVYLSSISLRVLITMNSPYCLLAADRKKTLKRSTFNHMESSMPIVFPQAVHSCLILQRRCNFPSHQLLWNFKRHVIFFELCISTNDYPRHVSPNCRYMRACLEGEKVSYNRNNLNYSQAVTPNQ